MSRQRVVHVVVVAWAVFGAACGRRDDTPTPDSVVPPAAPAERPATKATGAWSNELGGLLVVPTDSENTAAVLYPDAPSASLLASGPMTLVNSAGDTVRVRIVGPDSQQCGDADIVRLDTTPEPWSIGLLGHPAVVLHMDSIESLPSADSARLVTDLARLASALGSPRESRFTGLPFSVIGAHQLDVDGRRFVIAHMVRRLSIEAAPLEERTLIIAERPANAQAGEPYAVTYSRRSEGAEDAAEHFEVLAAMRGSHSLLLLLARDQQSQTDYELLERPTGGKWRSRWSRTLAC